MKNCVIILMCLFALAQSSWAQHIIVTNDGYAIKTDYLEMGQCNVYYQGISDSPFFLKIAKNDVMIIRLKNGNKLDPASQGLDVSCTNDNTLIVTNHTEVIKGRNVEVGENYVFYQQEGYATVKAVPIQEVMVIKYADGRKETLDGKGSDNPTVGHKVPPVPPSSTTYATVRQPEYMAPEDDEIYLDVDEDAAFPGGQKGLNHYFNQNMRYPKAAWNKGISGQVYVTFVVEKNGDVTGAKVLRDIGGGCGEEALRLVLRMPRWKPAKKDGKVVRTEMNIPVEFVIE